VDWIYLAQNRVKWYALVNMVMNLCVPYKVKFLTGWVTDSWKGIFSMEFKFFAKQIIAYKNRRWTDSKLIKYISNNLTVLRGIL
jgi:hypothetical protein